LTGIQKGATKLRVVVLSQLVYLRDLY